MVKSPKYTRRHFQDIAGTIKEITPKAKREKAAMDWARKFALDNPRFDMGKFVKACGL
jgi:hypothetical protein